MSSGRGVTVPAPAALTGVLPVLSTPFRDDETIDADALAAEIEWAYEHGADGVVVAMVSEIVRLAVDEREQLAEFACQANRERGPIIVSVGAESSAVAARLAQHAKAIGASAMMATPPLCSSYSLQALRRYYEDILASSALPLVVQDASGYAGKPLPLDFQAQLLADYGAQRVLFKPEAVPTGPRLSSLMKMTGGMAQVFEGSGGLALIDSYRRGLAGTMPGTDLVWATSALWKALESDRWDRAYQINESLTPLLVLLSSLDAYVAIQKYLLVKQGALGSSRVREPAGFNLDEPTRAEIDRLFERLKGFFDLDGTTA